jgi:putative nucleotidyltransferase with HDIG domain
MIPKKNRQRFFTRYTFLSVVILFSSVILAYAILIQPWSFRPASPSLQIGDVVQQDLRAPKYLEYTSEIRTEEARNEAERAVEPVYAPPDPTIARGQIENLQNILEAITGIKVDPIATYDEKFADLIGIKDLNLSEQTSYNLLLLTIDRWDLIRSEALNILEQVMRGPIQSDVLDAIKEGLVYKVSLSLNETEIKIVVDLVLPLVAVNSFYSPELTDSARLLARNSVQPVLVSYRQGEMIISSGQVINPTVYEALKVQNLITPMDYIYEFLGGGALVIMGAVLLVLFLYRSRPIYMHNVRSLLLLAILFLVFFASARFSIPNRTIIPYLFPIPAFGLLISSLFGIQSGIITSLILCILTVYGLPNALDLMPYYFLSSIGSILVLGSARRVGQFLWAAVMIACVGFSVVIAYRFPNIDTDMIGLVTLAGASLFNGIASTSLALLLQFLLAQFLGSTTALQLLEISRPDYPLLKYLLRKAPGTYQHSLQVMNLAEQAAEKIGADALLTRVGALYHDVGKSENASFFIENQLPGNIDAHNDIDPVISATTIIAHVTDGLFLAQKYRLPRRLHDFISEHHGTLLTRYQYNRALELAGDDKNLVDRDNYRYPGPAPRSRETALLMFADGVEAIVRAKQPKTEEELRTIVQNVVENAQKEGQLNDTPLTQRDLSVVIESFITTMQGVYHPRLDYPKEKVQPKSEIPEFEEVLLAPKTSISKNKRTM